MIIIHVTMALKRMILFLAALAFLSQGYAQQFKMEEHVNAETADRSIKQWDTAQALAGRASKEVLDRYIQAIGGRALLDSIQEIKLVSTDSLMGRKTTVTEIVRANGYYSSTSEAPSIGVLMRTVSDGESVYKEIMGTHRMELDSGTRLTVLERSSITGFLNANEKLERHVLGTDSGRIVVRAVRSDGATQIEYYGSSNSLLLMTEVRKPFLKDTVRITRYFDDYRPCSNLPGLLLPHLLVVITPFGRSETLVKDSRVVLGPPVRQSGFHSRSIRN
jgi:hypothetical protein